MSNDIDIDLPAARGVAKALRNVASTRTKLSGDPGNPGFAASDALRMFMASANQIDEQLSNELENVGQHIDDTAGAYERADDVAGKFVGGWSKF